MEKNQKEEIISYSSTLTSTWWIKTNEICRFCSTADWNNKYSRRNSTMPRASGAGNVSEHRPISQVGGMREVVCP